MPAYVLLAIAIVAEVIATTALKASAGFTRLGPSVVVAVGYAIAFFLLAHVVERIPVGIAYAIWAGGGIVLVALTGWAVYGQRPDVAGVAGMGLILAGVVVLNVWSKMSANAL